MAYEISTAQNYLDLMSKVATFAAANGWTVLRDTSADPSDQQLALKAPNSACFFGMRAVSGTIVENDSAVNYHNWELNGFSGWAPGLHVFEQIDGIKQKGFLGSNSNYDAAPRFTLTDRPFEYLLRVNDRRIDITASINGSDLYSHLGLLDAYGSSGEYPYPMLIAGNMTSHSTVANQLHSFRHLQSDKQSTYMTSRVDMNSNFMFGAGYVIGSTKVRTPGGEWSSVHNSERFYNEKIPNYNSSYSKVWPGDVMLGNLGKNRDGSYPIFPVMIMDSGSGTNPETGNWLGEVNGVFVTSGRDNFSGNIITVGADQYKVFKNISRDGNSNFFALKLE